MHVSPICVVASKKCVSFILECGYYRNQYVMMHILLTYTGVKYRDNNVDLPALFAGQHPNLYTTDLLRWLEPLNTPFVEQTHNATGLPRTLRTFLNYVNRTATRNVVPSSIRFVYFNGKYVDLFPIDEAALDFNRCAQNIEFAYDENGETCIAIIDDDNLDRLQIEKRKGNYLMKFMLGSPLRIRNCHSGEVVADTKGITTIDIVFNTHFDANELNEVLYEMVSNCFLQLFVIISC